MTHCLWAIYFISRILRFLICREGTVTARASAGCHGDQMTFLGSTELSTCHIRKCLLHSGCYCWLGSQVAYAWVGRAYSLLLCVLGCPFVARGSEHKSKRLVSSFHLSAICPYRLFKICAGLRLVMRRGRPLGQVFLWSILFPLNQTVLFDSPALGRWGETTYI